ncbi:1786_t:CDS:10 [Funneliformis geosporum]|uniref:192_t:CDS:1 n=1 Tax=Funneliformis geosporum TaxID=1117311 RepID=A0A9W4WUY9_9GLOM|nr:1786_t:CDS:10 [Funneliformis geosporum]CAI2174052.1 192_t:CDS:10 [Funneliformis geosporum]
MGENTAPFSDEKSHRGPNATSRFDTMLDRDVKLKSKKFALNYEEELERIQIIIIKTDDNRELHLIDEQDKLTYDKIYEFVKINHDAKLMDVVDHFQNDPNSDAIAKIVLGYKYPDYILKFIDNSISEHISIPERERQHRRSNFERLLLRSGLILEHEKDLHLKCTYVKVFAPFERLCEEAKNIRLKMRLDDHYLPTIEIDPPARSFLYPITKYFKHEINLNKGSAFFRRDRLRQFEGAGPEKSIGKIILYFFPSSRRILMVNRIIGTANQIHIKKVLDNSEPIVYKRIIKSLSIKVLHKNKTYNDIYPLHDGKPVSPLPLEEMNLRAKLNELWVKSKRRQPLETIRLYFGEKLALYFAWLGFYTTWLAIASIIGVIVIIYGLLEYFVFGFGSENANQDVSIIWDNALTAPFALFMAIWSTCFLETWKRFNTAIQYDWDVLEYEKEELPRPEFYGTELRRSRITMKQEIHFPFKERFQKILISVFVVLICVMIVIVSVSALLIAPKLWINLGSYKSWVTAITNLIIIFYMNMLYMYVADWLTTFENHRTETSYEDSLILKSYLFDFVNCYSGLFYILFFKEKFIKNIINQEGITGCDYTSCMTDLTIQLTIVLVGKQIFGQFNEFIWPWMRSVVYKRRIREEYVRYTSSGERKEEPQWTRDDKLYSAYGSERSEYEEMVVQFGFISLFGIAFPLTPLFAWANNVLEIRSDAFNYVFSLQRTNGIRAQDIGMWEKILSFVSLLSVLTNAIIMAFHSTWMRNKFTRLYGSNENQLLVARLVFILLFEHLVFVVKLAFSYVIADIPQEVQFAIEREKYLSKITLEDESPALDEFFSESRDDDSLFEDDEIKLPKRRRPFTADDDV